MYLYNSATHKKEEFKTHTPGHVEMYTCGPTVYHFAHIGPPHRTHGRARWPCPTKQIYNIGRDPCVPLTTAFSVMCHCEASAHTGCGNPRPPSPSPYRKIVYIINLQP